MEIFIKQQRYTMYRYFETSTLNQIRLIELEAFRTMKIIEYSFQHYLLISVIVIDRTIVANIEGVN